MPHFTNVIFFLSSKRKSGNFELDDVDANISEKDRMLREKEAEVLKWLELRFIDVYKEVK